MRTLFHSLIPALLLCGLLLCSPFSHGNAAYRIETVAHGLDYPWNISFLPDGSALVTELGGRLRRITADGEVGSPIQGVPPVYRKSQGGLFDVLPHPDFAENHWIYLSYADGTKISNATTLARARLQGNTLQNLSVLFSASPRKATPVHFGGRLAWMPDGTLLLTIGDGWEYREKAQALDTHFGKTLRMNGDGSPAAGNPFPLAPYVWTYGHRNPQGLAVDPSGIVYEHEHGPMGGDEVNILRAGKNYGWPAITYGMDYNGAYVSPFTEYPGMEQPLHVWIPSIAPSGLMVYQGSLFPAWQGDLFITALNDKEVRRLDMASGEVLAEEALFSELDTRLRDICEAPDGSIYIVLDGKANEDNPRAGSIVRIVPGPTPGPVGAE